MLEAAYPPVAELLPHRGPAVLLERVLEHDTQRTVCAVDPAAGAAMRDADGSIPAAFGLEFMAQTVAAHGGLLDRAGHREPRPGFFLGSRRLTFHAARFEPGQLLEVEVKHIRGNVDRGSGMLAFDCALRTAGEGAVMVSGVLTVYLLESFAALDRDFASDD